MTHVRMPAGPTGDYIGDFMDERPVRPERAALVVVDMQYATGARDGALGRQLAGRGSDLGAWRFDRIERLVVPNTQALLRAFRTARRPVVYVTMGAQLPDASDAPPHMRALLRNTANHVGSREHDVLDALAPLPGELVVRKTSIGAFASTGIDNLLRALGCEQLYMTGVSTNMCVETTAREAADRGYLVTLVEDACATTHADLHAATLRNFARLFGRVRSSAEVADEIGRPPANGN